MWIDINFMLHDLLTVVPCTPRPHHNHLSVVGCYYPLRISCMRTLQPFPN